MALGTGLLKYLTGRVREATIEDVLKYSIPYFSIPASERITVGTSRQYIIHHNLTINTGSNLVAESGGEILIL